MPDRTGLSPAVVRICAPRPVGGIRGAGLGNEVFPWAKAYLASRELGFRLLPPVWGLNPRGYRAEFGTSRLDWAARAARLATTPVVRVTDEMVRGTGESDYGLAIRALDAEYHWSRRRSLLLTHEGMSGGYLGIARARDFLRNTLLGRLPDTEPGPPPRGGAVIRVAVHARLGDFADGAGGPRPGTFNARVPADWYRAVLLRLRERLGPALSVDVVSDDPAQAARLLPEWAAAPAGARTTREDLSVMAAADLLVCSVSSLSMLAAFLSDAPYVWYRPHLGEREGFLSIWGHEDAQREGPTAAHIRQARADAGTVPARGVAMDTGDGLPRWLTDYLTTRVRLRRAATDLLHYGVVPALSVSRA